MPQRIAPKTSHELVVEMIRGEIGAGVLSPGDRLPTEAKLALDAGVSRSTLREALRVLQEAGDLTRLSRKILVVAEPQLRQSAPVAALSEGALAAIKRDRVTFRDLVDAALAVDPAVTRLATMRARAADLDRLQTIVIRQRASVSEPEAWCQADDEFHLAIAEVAGNIPLLIARRLLVDLQTPSLWSSIGGAIPMSQADHERILERILDRDEEGAEFAARQHIVTCREKWLEAGLDPKLVVR